MAFKSPSGRLFEEYMVGRWDFGERQRQRLINAVDLSQKIAFNQAEILTGKDEKSDQIGKPFQECVDF